METAELTLFGHPVKVRDDRPREKPNIKLGRPGGSTATAERQKAVQSLESFYGRSMPTTEGIKRYPPTGHYDANESPGPACTCTMDCHDPCSGRCGCKACAEAYGDSLSSQGD